MSNKPTLISLALVVLAACSNSPAKNGDDAYWDDQQWDGKLLDTVQRELHYPLGTDGQPVKPIPQEARATVGFTYVAGKIQDPRIIETSGRPDLDAAFLTQVVTASPPRSHGSHAAEAHPFELVLEMPTPMQEFEVAEYKAISAEYYYPREALETGAQGTVVVGFKYSEGTARDIKVEQSSRNVFLDRASMQAVAHAHMPQRPAWMPPEPLNMTVSLCYSLGNSGICTRKQQVLQVSGNTVLDQPVPPSSSTP